LPAELTFHSFYRQELAPTLYGSNYFYQELLGHHSRKGIDMRWITSLEQHLLLSVICIGPFTLIGCGGGASTNSVAPVPVLQSIAVMPASVTIQQGQMQQFTAQCTFSNGPGTCPGLSWNSSNTNVATVNGSGLATASNSNAGSTNITASASGITSNNATLTVVPVNTVALIVDAGPPGTGFNSVDTAFVSVTVCVPGTANCQTINHVIVDTGSSGLRILKSGSAPLTVPLAQEGNLVECAQFVSFFTWGPVMTADVKMGGEVASNIPIQVIGEANTGFPNIPAACQNSVPQGQFCPSPPCSADTLQTLGANGLLGLSFFLQDCGPACAASASPGFYYACPTASTCAQSTATLAQQVGNPVGMFAADNNGLLIQFPAIGNQGQANLAGTMTFGIGTQSNNGLSGATVFTPDQFGNFTATCTTASAPCNGNSYPGSFIDSGSTGIFFLTPALTGLPDCGGANAGLYCPAAITPFTATNHGANAASKDVMFQAANANQLSGADNAFNDLTGSNPTCFVSPGTMAPCFDWGLPFFFGRTVYVGIEGRNFPGGVGPIWAY
jgi:hypothetical protein